MLYNGKLSQLVRIRILGRGIKPSHLHFAAGRHSQLGLLHGMLQAVDLIRLVRFPLGLGVSRITILKMS